MVRENSSIKNKISLNNVDALVIDDELEQAYAEIVEKTNIQPLKLAYIPNNMNFVKADVGKTWATIYFEYNQHWTRVCL